MKVLTIDAAFQLPVDFDGDVADAVVLMADYIKANYAECDVEDHSVFEFHPEIWGRFLDRPLDHRVAMAAGVSEPFADFTPPGASE